MQASMRLGEGAIDAVIKSDLSICAFVSVLVVASVWSMIMAKQQSSSTRTRHVVVLRVREQQPISSV